jgi:RES domain-containing protein
VRAYRLEQKKYEREALNGVGARLYGGRWNSVGRFVVYASSSIALAALEILAKAPDETFLVPLIVIPLVVPDDLIHEVRPRDLPDGWTRKIPATRAIGDQWIADAKWLALSVPSAIVQRERNLLLNPRHPEMRRVQELEHFPFRFDTRLRKQSGKS